MKLLTAARQLHETDEVWELADIQDYLIHLTLDALGDKKLALDLAEWFIELARWLRGLARPHTETKTLLTENFYIGFLSALGQLLSLHHELQDVYLHRFIDRAEFMQSWKRTAEKRDLKW